MRSNKLTISQLAAHVGVTVRAIRHYHARGLLPEPARDDSGYRRYDAQAVMDLIRIKTLAVAGVPLAGVKKLLDASPAEFNAAIEAIDQTLQTRIRELEQHRRRLAGLARGERLFLPDTVVEILDQLRALGVSERTVQIERDGWILMGALSPELVPELVARKRLVLADPEFQRIYLATDQAREWPPDDPRLDQLAETLANWAADHPDPQANARDRPGLGAGTLLIDQAMGAQPAWQRLNDLARDRLRASRHQRAGPPSPE